MTREADGTFKQGFKARDDYGVVAGRVTITLDLAAVSRRHGLTVEPEPIAPVVLDLPMPLKGGRDGLFRDPGRRPLEAARWRTCR